jgi:hypothetical protein
MMTPEAYQPQQLSVGRQMLQKQPQLGTGRAVSRRVWFTPQLRVSSQSISVANSLATNHSLAISVCDVGHLTFNDIFEENVFNK